MFIGKGKHEAKWDKRGRGGKEGQGVHIAEWESKGGKGNSKDGGGEYPGINMAKQVCMMLLK